MKIYFVKQGDTLSELAVKYGLTVDDLMKANPLVTNPDELKVGQKLFIPAKKQEDCPDPAPPPIVKPIAEPVPHVVPAPVPHPVPELGLHQIQQQIPQQILPSSNPAYPQYAQPSYQQPFQQQIQQPPLYQPAPEPYQQQLPQPFQQPYAPQQPLQPFQQTAQNQQMQAYPPFASFPVPAVQASGPASYAAPAKPGYPWTPYASYGQQSMDSPYNTPFNTKPYMPTPPQPAGWNVQQPQESPAEWNPYRPSKAQINGLAVEDSPAAEETETAETMREPAYRNRPARSKKTKARKPQTLHTKLLQLQRHSPARQTGPRIRKSYPWMPD